MIPQTLTLPEPYNEILSKAVFSIKFLLLLFVQHSEDIKATDKE